MTPGKKSSRDERSCRFAVKTEQPDWSALLEADTLTAMTTAAASLLDAEVFSASSTRDALGRVLAAVSPDGSTVHYAYDEGGQLRRVTLNHRGSEATRRSSMMSATTRRADASW
jgi:YD repeat-containing protein